MKSNVLYSVVYNCSNGVSNKWRIKPFRLHLKENSGHACLSASIVDRIAFIKRHELKLIVFAFVFCIYAVRIHCAMKVRSIICLRYRHKETL